MRRLALFLLGLLFTVGAPAQTIVAGSTPGSFRVTESGTAEYRIPIQVPPGIAGMEPKLALVYNSQAGNGLVGVGWSLEGLSSITRCPRTVAQDGVRGGVNYDWNDRYCLDGQRLVAIAGAYGTDGTEYRTERESFSKVISYGVAGNGPAWFEVWTKSGQVLEYGNTPDSRIEAQGKATVRVWAVNKVSDTKGNYFSVTYVEDNPNGDYYASRIDYTGNSITGRGSVNSLQFAYEQRQDQTSSYRAGSAMRMTMRLKNISSVSGGVLAQDYRLTYDIGAGTNRSRLASVQQCVAGLTCLAQTDFAWQDSENGNLGWSSFWSASYGDDNGWGVPEYYGTVSFIDLNGDGLVDVCGRASVGLYCALNTGSGFAAPSFWSASYGDNNGWNFPQYYSTIQYPDLNGDGLPDVCGRASVGLYCALNTGSGFAPPSFWSASYGDDSGWGAPEYYSTIRFIDLNGDGLADVCGRASVGLYCALNTGSGFAPPSFWSPAYGDNSGWNFPLYYDTIQYPDLNGDGLPDVCGRASVGLYCALNNGSGFAAPSFWSPSYGDDSGWGAPEYYSTIRFIDLNGDGLADVCGRASVGLYCALNTGSGFAPPSFWSPAYGDNSGWNFPQYYSTIQYPDLNSDGLPDVCGRASVGLYCALNTGSGFAAPSFWSASYGDDSGWSPHQFYSTVHYPDLNGDGLADVCGRASVGLYCAASPSRHKSDLLVAVSSGLGGRIRASYKPLTDSVVYRKSSGAIYPITDVQPTLHVVSAASRDDATGGNHLTNYFYVGLKFHLQGGAFLGFGKVEVSEPQIGITTVTTFRQDYPFQGLPRSVLKTQAGGAVLSQVTNTWMDNPAGNTLTYDFTTGKYHRSDFAQSVENGADVNGATLPTVTTTAAYDAFGNTTSATVTTSDGYGKTTTNTYMNDATSWFLGRLVRSTVRSTAP